MSLHLLVLSNEPVSSIPAPPDYKWHSPDLQNTYTWLMDKVKQNEQQLTKSEDTKKQNEIEIGKLE